MLYLLIVLFAVATQATADYYRPDPFPSFHVFLPNSASVSDRNTRVINGNEAGVQQFPHQAGIYVNLNTFCGGALISPKWILTTATCADSPNARYTVYLGAHNINLPSEKNRRVVTTTQSYAHEGFDASTFRHDVGLILLPRDVKMSDYIKTINLPPKAYASETFSGVSLQLSGWGYTSDVSSTISPKLQYTDLKGVDAKACVETYSYEIYTDAILCCVGGNKQSSCQGDTGGALVKTEVDGSLTHIAVASFTPHRGCSTGKPAGFTRTASYLDWISSVAGIAVN